MRITTRKLLLLLDKGRITDLDNAALTANIENLTRLSSFFTVSKNRIKRFQREFRLVVTKNGAEWRVFTEVGNMQKHSKISHTVTRE